MNLLIDADIVAFKAASAVEQPVHWGDGLWTLHSFEHEAIAHCEDYFTRLKAKVGDGKMRLFLTSGTNWRKSILPSYKANRKDKRKPMLLMFLRNWMIAQLGAVVEEGLEADDLLGIAATQSPNDSIIVSEDKDLKTIPALLFNPAKDTEPRRISEFEADYNHMFQTLTGDVVDGFTGCPSVGPKTAEKILKDCTTSADLWDATLAAFQKQKLSKEVALVQAQVARICRATDFDTNTQKVIPWTPKQ